MAFKITKLEGGPATLLVTVDDANGSANDDITGTGAAANTLYKVEVDCSENPGEDVACRIYNNTSPTVGTTAAEVLVPGFRGESYEMVWSEGIPFSTAISVAVVKDAGATSGTTNPTGTVKLRIWCRDS